MIEIQKEAQAIKEGVEQVVTQIASSLADLIEGDLQCQDPATQHEQML